MTKRARRMLSESSLVPAALAALVALTACAPAATTETAPGERGVPGAGAEAERPQADAADTSAARATPKGAPSDSAAALEARLVEMALAARGPEPELSPIKPLGVSWSPEPREGAAFSVRLYERPTGRKPVSVEGEFAGRPVRFARYGSSGHWLGVGMVPIGHADPAVLRLNLRFEDGARHEQTVRIAVEPTEFPRTELRVDPRYSSPPPEVLERIRAESRLVRELLATVTPEWRLDGPFRAPRPLDVTSPFGQARTFNGELRSRHTGLDLRGQPGAPVHAAASGRVVFAGELYFGGNVVYVDHGLGVYTGYYHLSRIHVERGEDVSAGQLVGEVGATGRVTGPHLHWYLAVDGEAVDAASLLGMRLPG